MDFVFDTTHLALELGYVLGFSMELETNNGNNFSLVNTLFVILYDRKQALRQNPLNPGFATNC